MDARLEVAVAGEHGADDEVGLGDRGGDLLRQRAGVPDAGRAAVADRVEAERLEVRREAGLLVVVGHDPRSGRQARLHPRLPVEAAFDRLLRQEPGGDHHLRIGGVRAARDRSDHDAAVLELELEVAELDVGGGRLALGNGDRGGRRSGGLIVSGLDVRGRVGRGKALGDSLVLRVPVVDSEARQLVQEGVLRLCERDAVLRSPRPGEAGLDGAEVELDHVGVRRVVLGPVPEQVLLAVRLDERDPLVGPAGQAQVLERGVVDREEAAGGAVLGRHVPDRRPVGQRERAEPRAEVLDELADHAGRAEDLGHREHEVGGGRPFGERTGQAEPDHLRDEHRERLAQHRRLGLDPADAPAEHTEPVDHGRVRVGADQRVRERLPVARLDHAGQVLEVDLVDDPRAGRDDLQVGERLLSPAQEGIALPVALELELDVAAEGEAGGELVDLDGVVDHQLGGDDRVDLPGVAAEVLHRVPHCREVDDRRHAGEVLVDDAARPEGDLAPRLLGRHPARDRLDIVVAPGPQRVLQQDAQRVGKPGDVPAILQCIEPEDFVRLGSDA